MKKESRDQLFERGNQFYNSGKFSEALTSYSRALEIDPEMAATHYNMGIALRKLGRFEEAIASYSRALEIDPKKVEAH
jgi:tetratricopeptide (TPR) repeat protein